MKLLLTFVSPINLAIGAFWTYVAGSPLLAGEGREANRSR